MRMPCPAHLAAFLLLGTVLLGILATPAAAQNIPPCRAYRTAPGDGSSSSGLMSYDQLLIELGSADVVFLGEYHDDPATHVLQKAILVGLFVAREGEVALSMEQFERDVQDVLDSYLAGKISEEDFLKQSRPWPNYDPDYRQMIEFAKRHQIPVVAANIPRPLASRIAKQGFDAAWVGYTPEERRFIAERTTAPQDLYYYLFKKTMGVGVHGGMEMPEAMLYQVYQAQCIKDDTMAESIARERAAEPGKLVVHTNGSFHCDYRQGTVPRLIERRQPPAAAKSDRVIVVAIRPVGSFSEASARVEELTSEELAAAGVESNGMGLPVADYIVFVLAPGAGQFEMPLSKPAGEEEAGAEEGMPAMPMPPATAPAMPPSGTPPTMPPSGGGTPPQMPPQMPPK